MKDLEIYIQKMNQQHEMYVLIENLLNDDIVKKIEKYCFKKGYPVSFGNFLNGYEKLKGTPIQPYFDKILLKRNLHFSSMIRESISYLLSPKEDLDVSFSPFSFPGILDISKKEEFYRIFTTLGLVKVKEASLMFQDNQNTEIFKKTLAGCCYARCYEFLKLNPEYQVVFSYMPNDFVGGHLHVYLKNKNSVIDVSSNAYYNDLTFKIPLRGKIFKIASLEEIEKEYQAVSSYVSYDDVLYVLSHYYLMENAYPARKLIHKF